MISIAKIMRTVLFSSLIFLLAPLSASAVDFNLPGFTGSVNTTITSGFSMRASGRNCSLQDGYTYNIDTSDLNATYLGLIAVHSGGLSSSQLLSGYDKNAETSGSCANFRTDAYGNTSTNRIEYGNVNNDNGNLNFDNGDIVDATQKAFVDISGSTPDGTGVNLSFITNYNPVLDINSANFIDLTSAAKDELESDIELLDAYITSSFDLGDDFGYLDVTAGRFVTSWGEATFIPVGLNGLTTNALDLTKLRAPGASIRDALMPTEQISLSFSAGNVGFEVYTQFSSESVELDPKGSFFGNDVVGTGGDRILANGAYAEEVGDEAYCPYAAILLTGGAFSCDSTLKAYTLAESTRHNYNDAYQAQWAYRNASANQWMTWAGLGATLDHGQTFQALATPALVGTPLEGMTFKEVENTLAAFTSSMSNAVLLPTVYSGTMDADFTKAATVELRAADQKFVQAKDDGQWGIRASTYLDNVGTGVDLGFYYANYHSKVPYFQAKGKTGVLGGDIIGAFTHIFADFAGATGGGDAGIDLAVNTADATSLAAANGILIPLLNGAFGSVCSGLGSTLGNASAGVGAAANSQDLKNLYANARYKKLVDGSPVHDPTTCTAVNTSTYQNIFTSLTPTLAAAVTPLNYARYEFIYPEDIQVLGMSFNTNVDGTTIQGEISYRPDFPLATGSGDQINQIADASGTTLALTAFGHDTYALASANIAPGIVLPGVVDALAAASAISKDFSTLLKESQRSSLPVIDPSLVKVYDATSYYDATPFIKYDVISADIGTTTIFSASHPVSQSIGADSSVLLTELAMVQINGMDNRGKGFVSRGGFNEGSGEHLCLGIFGGLSAAEIAAVNTTSAGSGVNAIDHDLSASGSVTNVGASIVDAVFGNGSYCEGQMGADERSFSYRIVGSATYNNFNNSAWTLSPSFVWSADPLGYGPSSLGGFVEGRESLSLGLTASRSDSFTASVNYVNQMGDEISNLRGDMDYISANVSYAF